MLKFIHLEAKILLPNDSTTKDIAGNFPNDPKSTFQIVDFISKTPYKRCLVDPGYPHNYENRCQICDFIIILYVMNINISRKCSVFRKIF